MDKATRILKDLRIVVNALNEVAAGEVEQADKLDGIMLGAGDRDRGRAAGMKIAARLIEQTLSMFGEEGQDAQIDIQVHRHEKGAQGAAGPADRQ
jgi:hypothetical protein